MKSTAVSVLKAKLSRYLRMVKAGEEIEIQERGVPIALLTSVAANRKGTKKFTVPPRSDSRRLGKMKFTVRPSRKFDIVALLLSDREKR